MGLTDKNKIVKKEDMLKPHSYGLWLSSVKSFNGNRHRTIKNIDKNGKRDYRKEESGKKHLFREKPLTKTVPNVSFHEETQQKLILTNPSKEINLNNQPFNFNEHMSQWAEEFWKPLTKSATHFEFDMPYCYSEEFYNQVSARCFISQPFSSIGEPLVSWNSQVNVWYEKAQMALQFYRQLSGQPSRLPLKMINIKTDDCTLMGGSDLIEPMICLYPDQENRLNHAQMHMKNDTSIYTSSWQN